MSDYSTTKPKMVSNYPQDAAKTGTSGFQRVEPFMTVDRLKNEFLFGVPLASFITGQPISDETLASIIRRAAASVETKTGLDLYPVQRIQRVDFDYTKFMQGYNQINLAHMPLLSLEEVSIRLADSTTYYNGTQVSGFAAPGQDVYAEQGRLVYRYPLQWLNITQRGMLTMAPPTTIIGGNGFVGIGSSNNGMDTTGAVLMTQIARCRHFPSFYMVAYTSGLGENTIPSEVNTLIANIATVEILSLISNTNIFGSKSISLDAASQSVSTNGGGIFANRIEQLNNDIKEGVAKIRAKFTRSITMNHI